MYRRNGEKKRGKRSGGTAGRRPQLPGSNEQIVKLEKTFNHPTRCLSSQLLFYIFMFRRRYDCGSFRIFYGSRSSLSLSFSFEGVLNKIITHTLTKSFTFVPKIIALTRCSNTRKFTCGSLLDCNKIILVM